jgi:H+/gluconate symporter-like permease
VPPVASSAPAWYLVACAGLTVLTLLLLIVRLRLHPALALVTAGLGLGIVSGMPLIQVPVSFTAGVGNLMGHIAIVQGMAGTLLLAAILR